MGALPERCERFELPQCQVLFVVYLLLSDIALSESAAGRSMARSADGFGVEVALRIFNRFIPIPTPPNATPFSRELTPNQTRVIRALSLAVAFAAAGFKRWWEKEELNRQFGWHTEGFIGRKLFLAKELLAWAFPACELPDPILSAAVERELQEIDFGMKYPRAEVNWLEWDNTVPRRKKRRRKEEV